MQPHPSFQHLNSRSQPGNSSQDAPQAMTQHLQYVKAMQDQATALSNSVQDLQQQLKDLQLPDQIQQELVPIQDSVRKTTQDLNRLVGEQRQKNADAERLEGQAMKARMEASAAAERIQYCQNSLQAAEGRLAAKKHEISLKKQEAQFKAAELEFHQQQLQHVSEEQRQAEELIQISLDQNGGHSMAIPERVHPHRAHQQMAAPHAAMPDMPSYEQGSGSGEGIFNKLKGGMDKARQMGQKVVPNFGPDRERMAQASSICMHSTHHGL
ncbi:MAG: hypothetical protein FRX49_00250 [Trebouxia sp. A1-2]|nr:MAG: hypothetical protein FRX49_00250 [Trebouxia sp. A1-2]